jgi:LuxR family maltose regulon positive regulatory protein
MHLPEPLLRTKLFIPPVRPNLVERPHLIEQLNQGLRLGHKLTLVSAPPGFGKTTLISSWIHQLNAPATWLSLDEGDNEPNRFVFYMIAALQEAHRELGESTLSLLQSPQPPPLETLLTLLINDLATLPCQAILILDDYHVIQNVEIHKALTFLLDHQPPQLHVIIVSREDPALPLHRLRGSGQMNGLYVRDLRFTAAEAATFLLETMGLSLSKEEVGTLERRTEGWVTGLQLAALSIKDAPNPAELVAAFAGDDRYIVDYLIAEVLERQPPAIREFLLSTALLDRFTASLCEAICVSAEPEAVRDWLPDSSREVIDQLHQANLFIIPLDNKREWYRYHHLFADFLRLRLKEWPASQIAELHRRAAAWFEDRGLLPEAIEHALEAKDYPQAADLIERTAMTTIFGRAQWAVLFDWIEALPADTVRARPRLSLQHAWALYTTGHWNAAVTLLEEIESILNAAETRTVETVRLLGETIAISALIAATLGDTQRSIEQARKALSLLPEDNLTMRCVVLFTLGRSAQMRGDAPRARETLQEAKRVALAAGNIAIAVFASSYLVEQDVVDGYLERAEDLYRQTRSLGTVGAGVILAPTGIACIEMGEALREWNRLDEAARLLNEGIRLCAQQAGLPNEVVNGQVLLARTQLATGDIQLASQTMQEAEMLFADLLARGGDVRLLISKALAHRLRFWLAQGKLEAAASWLAENNVSVDLAISPGDEWFHLLLARMLIEREHLENAQKQLERLEEIVATRKSPRMAVETLILRALYSQANGDQGHAESTIVEALLLAEPEGYLRLFVDQGESIIPLLEQVAIRTDAPLNAKAILTVLKEERRDGDNAMASAAQSPREESLVEPLKDRELQILRLIAAGLSKREIAAELFLSINTIKTYTSRIYGKLGVHRRAEAVDRAHELNLL